MSSPFDDDAFHAAVDLIGRSGAREFEIGYLHDDVPVEQAAWWAHAQYRGARIVVENHARPEAAAEALAVKVLSGGMCTHCRGLIALSDAGAVAYPGHLTDGSEMTEERARAMPQCRYRRVAAKWVRGCTDSHPDPSTSPPTPNRAARRRAARKERR
jgi:hypothetical protein